jgi:hypothetical protein
VIAASSSVAAMQESAAEQATAVFSQKDPSRLLSEGLFLFYRNFGDPALSKLGRAVWELDKQRYPELSWDLLEAPEFRINFAQLWALWARRVFRDEHAVGAIRSYVEPFLDSSIADRQAAAVNFLGSLGTTSDIPLLKAVALEERNGVAFNAVLAISKIGGGAAADALAEVERSVRDNDFRVRVREVRLKSRQK